MSKGIILRLATSDKGFYATLFKLFHLSIIATKDPHYCTTLMLGFYRFEWATTITVRRNLRWEEHNSGYA